MPSPKVDPEEFQAWLEQPLTRLVLQHFRQEALSIQERAGPDLLSRSISSAAEWASQQAQAAYLKALSDAYDGFANVSLEDIQEEDADG
jgi:uncharacterized phage-associated protein